MKKATVCHDTGAIKQTFDCNIKYSCYFIKLSQSATRLSTFNGVDVLKSHRSLIMYGIENSMSPRRASFLPQSGVVRCRSRFENDVIRNSKLLEIYVDESVHRFRCGKPPLGRACVSRVADDTFGSRATVAGEGVANAFDGAGLRIVCERLWGIGTFMRWHVRFCVCLSAFSYREWQ